MNNRRHSYLIANEADHAFGTVVTTAGQQIISPDTEYPPHDHPMRYIFTSHDGRVLNEYQMVYISQGMGEFVSTSMKKTSITAGDLFLLFPGEWHNYRPDPRTGWQESWIGFTGPEMDAKVKNGFFSPRHPILHVGIDSDLFGMFHHAKNIAYKQEPFYQQILAGITSCILGTIYSKDNRSHVGSTEAEKIISKAKILMRDNIDSRLSGEEIAKLSGSSYTKFRKTFKELTGFSPKQYMLDLKIAKAKELLTNTDMSCQEVGYASGFETPSFFHATFRKRTLMSPLEYRLHTRGTLKLFENR